MHAVEQEKIDPVLISLLRQVRKVSVVDGMVEFVFEESLAFYEDWLSAQQDVLVRLLVASDSRLSGLCYAFKVFERVEKEKIVPMQKRSVSHGFNKESWPKTYGILQYFPGKVEKV